MKVLEETPDKYESGIVKLTEGKINEVYEKILEHIKEGSKVLDLGCGPGTLAVLCAKKGAQVVAIDFSDEMIKFAAEKSQQEEVSDNITFIKGDITQLKTLLPKRKFDVIVSTLALSELRHLEQQLVFDPYRTSFSLTYHSIKADIKFRLDNLPFVNKANMSSSPNILTTIWSTEKP